MEKYGFINVQLLDEFVNLKIYGSLDEILRGDNLTPIESFYTLEILDNCEIISPDVLNGYMNFFSEVMLDHEKYNSITILLILCIYDILLNKMALKKFNRAVLEQYDTFHEELVQKISYSPTIEEALVLCHVENTPFGDMILEFVKDSTALYEQYAGTKLSDY